MSLRARLLAAIAFALLLSLAAGTILAGREAARMVGAEIVPALDSASQRLRPAALPVGVPELKALVLSFNNVRHVQVALFDATGLRLAASSPETPLHAAPGWFAALVTPALPARVVPVPGNFMTLRITAVPASEIAERWSDARDRVLLLGLLSLLTGLLCFFTAAHGMRPLARLADGFVRLGRGERRFAVTAAGPPEIAALATGFNHMAAALAEAETLNARLNRQLQCLAEEERVEIARNLHDEIGPLLFAITTFTATADRMLATTPEGVGALLRAIDDQVAALQLAVRDMLGRLRETGDEPIDLREALGRLIRFWQTIRPDMRFSLILEAESGLAMAPAGDVLYRVAQEAVSNAVRHGTPQAVIVALGATENMVRLSVKDDGQGMPAPGGYGLLGMHERVEAAGGTLDLQQGAGWTVTACVPAS
jgi:two-component system sensor histidine kinase UhpB